MRSREDEFVELLNETYRLPSRLYNAMSENNSMTLDARSLTTRTIIGIGVESLPWIGLAVGAAFLPGPVLRSVPSLHFLLPVLILVVGGLAIFGRRWWTSSGSSAHRPSPTADESNRTVPPPSGPQGDGAFAHPAPTLSQAPFEIAPTPGTDTRRGDVPSNRPSQGPSRIQREQDLPCREAGRDSLTGLADRTTLLEEVSALLEVHEDESGTPALISLTIDEYRDVTESFGHDAGQELLAAMAVRIENAIPPTATAARIAEDTFAVLLKQVNTDQASVLGRQLLNAFDRPFQIAGHQVPIQASAGLAIRPPHEAPFSNAKEMLQASYSAMHQVQRQGGGNLNVIRDGDREQSRWLQRRERLRKAIHEDELTLHYQPIVHLVSEEMVGAEALVRWNHPERGLLPPSAFFPLAEETGLVGEIDRWVLEESLQKARQWTSAPDGPVDWISVNVSPQSVDDDLQSWCREKLRGTLLPDGALHLEITERWALRDERSLRPLRDEGIRLAIDDFGTGYSSLRYLRSLDADVLKIDREFIRDLGRDQKTTAIVQFLMNLSLRLDVEVIAEGVETEEQEETLRDLGCAMAQGFHFARPVPAETLLGQTPLSGEQPGSSFPDDHLQAA